MTEGGYGRWTVGRVVATAAAAGGPAEGEDGEKLSVLSRDRRRRRTREGTAAAVSAATPAVVRFSFLFRAERIVFPAAARP